MMVKGVYVLHHCSAFPLGVEGLFFLRHAPSFCKSTLIYNRT